jgi:hypothetical protein
MYRRAVLAGGLSVGAGALAGCSSLLGQSQPQESKPQLEVFVANALEAEVRVTITARRGSTEFFSHTYSLGPGKGDESQSFVGTPTAVTVDIQNGRSVTREYSVPGSCESPELNVTIEPDEILVTNGCVNS